MLFYPSVVVQELVLGEGMCAPQCLVELSFIIRNPTAVRFAELEAVAVITMLVARHKVTVKDEPQFAYGSLEQKRDRLLRCTNLLSLTFVPCIFAVIRKLF
jgi:hypothetical protein